MHSTKFSISTSLALLSALLALISLLSCPLVVEGGALPDIEILKNYAPEVYKVAKEYPSDKFDPVGISFEKAILVESVLQLTRVAFFSYHLEQALESSRAARNEYHTALTKIKQEVDKLAIEVYNYGASLKAGKAQCKDAKAIRHESKRLKVLIDFWLDQSKNGKEWMESLRSEAAVMTGTAVLSTTLTAGAAYAATATVAATAGGAATATAGGAVVVAGGAVTVAGGATSAITTAATVVAGANPIVLGAAVTVFAVASVWSAFNCYQIQTELNEWNNIIAALRQNDGNLRLNTQLFDVDLEHYSCSA